MTREEFDIKIQELLEAQLEFDIKIKEMLEAQLEANSIAEELSKAEEFTMRNALDILEYIHEDAIDKFKRKNEKASLENLKSYWGDFDDEEEEEDDFDESQSEEDRDEV